MLEKYNCKYILICGHYGCGKTNLAINLAAECRKRGESVTLVDLDIVNPYFRSSDFAGVLEQMKVKLIAPAFAHSNLDLPALPAQMYSIFSSSDDRVIIDVGGDDQGATALGRFARKFYETGNFMMIYVVNQFRPLLRESKDAVELLQEIERASRMKASAVFNNSHLMQNTTAEDVLSAQQYAEEISESLNLPLIGTAVPRSLYDQTAYRIKNLYAVDIFVKTPWDQE